MPCPPRRLSASPLLVTSCRGFRLVARMVRRAPPPVQCSDRGCYARAAMRAMSGTIRVMQFGCGPIGCSIVRLAARRASLSVCGAVDIDPALVGRGLEEVAAAPGTRGALVHGDARAALAELRPDLVFHTTGSKVAEVYDQLALIAAAGANVVFHLRGAGVSRVPRSRSGRSAACAGGAPRRGDPGHRGQSRFSHGRMAAVHVDAVRGRAAGARGAGTGRRRTPGPVSAQDRRRPVGGRVRGRGGRRRVRARGAAGIGRDAGGPAWAGAWTGSANRSSRSCWSARCAAHTSRSRRARSPD